MDELTRSKAYDYRMRTPSPKSKRISWASPKSPPTFSDRLIPSRAGTNFSCGFDLLEVKENLRSPNSASPGSALGTPSSPHGSTGLENGAARLYDQVLQSELLGKPSPQRDDEVMSLSPENQNLFQYKSMLEEVPPWFCGESELSRSPVPLRIAENSSQPKMPRKIQKNPVRIMDAPDIQDDFYFNLLDWSAADDLAVALGSCVYSWNAVNNSVTKSCDLGCNSVTSVNWADDGLHLAVGASSGDVQIFDRARGQCLRTLAGHEGNVCSLAWNGCVLSTGGQDGCIIHRDVRQPAHCIAKVSAHRLQVCGLKWSHDKQQLASGSDDCTVRIWSLSSRPTLPVLECSKHQAAVKALTWSPHQLGLLASGGGVADKRIHIWNTTNDVTVKSVDTGSQVCNLIWSKNVNEIVSTHGFSQYEVAIWKYPTMSRVTTLTGHRHRVLYLAISPDGRKIATGSGDCSVRVWEVFPAAKACGKSSRVALLPGTIR